MTGTGAAGPVTWVIGAGGLLGSNVCAELSRRPGRVLRSAVPWTDPAASGSALRAGMDTLLDLSRGQPGGWRIAWCAGAGVTGTSATVLDQEVATFTGFLADLADRGAEPGALFVASSAGAVFAGAGGAPFTEEHATFSLSGYGEAKLAAEAAARSFARRTGSGVLVGRIANLYGPGQNLGKSQGLISHLCRSNLTGQPVSIFVSLDTIRDYLYVGDCARMVTDGLDRAAGLRGGSDNYRMKILASERGVSIGAIIAECRRVFKKNPRVVLGTSPNARFQVRDLRMRSVVWPGLGGAGLTTLPAGIAATGAALRRRALAGGC